MTTFLDLDSTISELGFATPIEGKWIKKKKRKRKRAIPRFLILRKVKQFVESMA